MNLNRVKKKVSTSLPGKGGLNHEVGWAGGKEKPGIAEKCGLEEREGKLVNGVGRSDSLFWGEDDSQGLTSTRGDHSFGPHWAQLLKPLPLNLRIHPRFLLPASNLRDLRGI